MNPRIAKDIRLIAIPVAIGIAGMLLVSGLNQFWCLLAWVIACTFLVAAGFAGELVPNGLAFSLTMPVPRRQLWKEKMFVMGGGLVALTLALLLVDLRLGPVQNIRSTAPWFLLTFPLFAFGAGAALSLWTRQPIATIWLLLLALGLAFVLTEWLVPLMIPSVHSSSIFEGIIVGLAIYGGYLGRRQFLNFEDDQSETSFQGLDFGRLFARPNVDQRSVQTSATLPVLLRKELALQQINFVVAIASVLFITVSGVAVLKSGNEWMGYVSMLTKMIALFVAFSVGAVAFSEEHVIGTSLLNMSLPATRRTQFLVKSVVTLVCGVLLAGGGMLIIDWLVATIAPSSEFSPVYKLRSSYAILLCLVTPFMATLAGAFASSFSRTFLASLSGTFVLGMALWGSYPLIFVGGQWMAASPFYHPWSYGENNALLFVSAVPILAIVFLWRSWRNFSADMLAGGARFKSARTVAVAVLLIFAINLFFAGRLWELAEAAPTEARFGKAPARNHALKQPIFSRYGNVFVTMDGSLWQFGRRFTTRGMPYDNPTPGRIGTESDWRDLAEKPDGFFALKQDGSLWACGELADPRVPRRNYLPKPEATRLRSEPSLATGFFDQPVAVFPGVKWRMLAKGMSGFETVAIRDDGTLWLWGSPEYREPSDGSGRTTFDIRNSDGSLMQIGGESDWKDVICANGVYFSLKEDGSVWIWGNGDRKYFDLERTETSFVPTLLPLDTKIAELVFGGSNSSVILRPIAGPAIVFGEWLRTMTVPTMPSGLDVIAIKQPFHWWQTNSYFVTKDLYLTTDNLVLLVDRHPEMEIEDFQGTNWVALSALAGFTRDGSFWSRYRGGVEDRPSVGDHFAQWLGLTYGNEQTKLIPPRWRIKRYDLAH